MTKMKTTQIALIGDYSEDVRAHLAIPRALEFASNELGCNIQSTWIATDEVAVNALKASIRSAQIGTSSIAN
jgi:CTP synthase (UTP-ammonia lyase)